MLNPRLKLNPKIFNTDSSIVQEVCEKDYMRRGFGVGLLEAGKNDENIVALCADLSESLQMNLFKDKFPKRFIQVGVAEQNLVTIASGLAASSKIPFCGSYAVFSPGRNWEQIRTTVCYNNLPVKIIGSHAGLTVGKDGGSHQSLEDIALMRVLPNMEVYSPCDFFEAQKITEAIAKTNKPAFLRLSREKTPLITTKDTTVELGKAEIFWLPEVGLAQVGMIATGEMLYKTLLAARELESEGIKTKVLNLHTIKPIDKNALITLAKEAKCLVTIEDHQVYSGMGSAVAEVLAREYPVPIEFLGVEDKFGQSGNPDELLEHYGLDVKDIKEAVKKVIKRKTGN